MLYTIRHRRTGAVLFQAKAGSLKAAVEAAARAGADLYGANLSGATLREAKGLNKYLTTPLYFLHEQVHPIRLYKLVTKDGHGPFNGGIRYQVGKTYSVKTWDADEHHACGAGINLATLDWCLRYWEPGRRILIAEFQAKDLVAIPIASDGKFRVRRCRIVGEKDLATVGLTQEKDG